MNLPQTAHYILIGILIGLFIGVPLGAYLATRYHQAPSPNRWRREGLYRWKDKERQRD